MCIFMLIWDAICFKCEFWVKIILLANFGGSRPENWDICVHYIVSPAIVSDSEYLSKSTKISTNTETVMLSMKIVSPGLHFDNWQMYLTSWRPAGRGMILGLDKPWMETSEYFWGWHQRLCVTSESQEKTCHVGRDCPGLPGLPRIDEPLLAISRFCWQSKTCIFCNPEFCLTMVRMHIF